MKEIDLAGRRLLGAGDLPGLLSAGWDAFKVVIAVAAANADRSAAMYPAFAFAPGILLGRPHAGQPPRRDARACPAAHTVDIAVAMCEEETAEGAEPALRCLADKVNWLIDRARPADRGSWSNAEVAELIERTTGERVSYTTIWKLRHGQAANPQMKLIEAMARTFGVPPGFFFADYDTGQAGLLQEEVALLALVRSASSSAAELSVILGLSPEARQAVIDLMIALTAAR